MTADKEQFQAAFAEVIINSKYMHSGVWVPSKMMDMTMASEPEPWVREGHHRQQPSHDCPCFRICTLCHLKTNTH